MSRAVSFANNEVKGLTMLPCLGKSLSRCPRQRAGFSPSLSFRALADSRPAQYGCAGSWRLPVQRSR
jgi:hypothetical protein